MALGVMLDSHYWGFTLTRDYLTALAVTPKSGWMYAYAVPNTAMNIVSLFLDGSVNDDNPQDYEIESLADGTEVIYANITPAICRYTCRVTDPTKYQPLFVEAFVLLLMSYLAGPILKGDEGRKEALNNLKLHAVALNKAKESDASQRKITTNRTPAFMEARGAIPFAQFDQGGFPR